MNFKLDLKNLSVRSFRSASTVENIKNASAGENVSIEKKNRWKIMLSLAIGISEKINLKNLEH